MYYLTGLPGWIQWGYSPGWVGISPTGLPPYAQYLSQIGHIPQFASWIQQQQTPITPVVPTNVPVGAQTMQNEQEIAKLESQAQMLRDQLEQLKKRLEELKK